MAALNKRWVGTTTVPTLATNWAAINLTKPIYKWTQSPAQALEYYLELIGGGDPGISAPGFVYINSAVATEGTVGSLTAGQWDYADNDTLGFSTVYVRIGSDPDTQVIGYIQMYQIPVATDHVRIPAGSGAMDGVDWTGVALGDFIREPGHTGAIGSAAAPLMIDPDKFEWSGTGVSHVYSIGAIVHDVREAGGSGRETAGLYLTGTGITMLTVAKGTVGLAMLHGQTSTVTTVRVCGSAATVVLGKGVTLTTSYVAAGALYQHCNATTTNMFGNGKFYTEEVGTITTLNMDGNSQAWLNSTGTITTVNMLASYGGTVDMLGSAEARTITTLNHKSGTLKVDRAVVTITTYAVTDSKPQSVTIGNAA